MKYKNILFRYCFATLGVCIVALGIVFSVRTNLGISTLNTPAYAISAETGLSLGLCNIAFFLLCMLFQAIILRNRFQAKDLLQLVTNVLLGLMIDVFTHLLDKVNFAPSSLTGAIIFLVLSVIIQAIGISMEVSSGAWMLPADMTVRAIGLAWGGKFSDNKIKMDCTVLAIAALMCLIFFGNILGPQGQPIIGWGTLVLAVCIGLCMKVTSPIINRIPYLKG